MDGVFLAELSSVEALDADGLPASARMVPCGYGSLVTAALAVAGPLRHGLAADQSGRYWCICSTDGAGAVLLREDGGL